MEEIRIRGHHLPPLKSFLRQAAANGDLTNFQPALGTYEQNQRIRSIYELMMRNPGIKVKITASPDNICDICLTHDCDPSIEDTDRYLAWKNGLKCEKAYSAEDVMAKLKAALQ